MSSVWKSYPERKPENATHVTVITKSGRIVECYHSGNSFAYDYDPYADESLTVPIKEIVKWAYNHHG